MNPQNYTMNILIGLSNIFKKKLIIIIIFFKRKAIFAILTTTNLKKIELWQENLESNSNLKV